MTLEKIIKIEKARRIEDGDFGINACKEAVLFQKETEHKSLYLILEEYMKRAKEDIFFNKTMVLACWELINEEGEK